MKPQKFTTEDTEKKSFRFIKSSVNSVVASSPIGRHKKTNTVRAQRGKGSDFLVTFYI